MSQARPPLPAHTARTPGNHHAVGSALLAAVLFGVSAPLAKLLLRGAALQLLAGLLYVGSGLDLGIVWLFRRQHQREAPLTRHDAPWLAGATLAEALNNLFTATDRNGGKPGDR